MYDNTDCTEDDQRRFSKGNEALYYLLDRDIRPECNAAKENMLATQCDLIEQLDVAHTTNLMPSLIRLVTGKKHRSNSTSCIEDNERNKIMEKENLLFLWYKYRNDIPEIVV